MILWTSFFTLSLTLFAIGCGAKTNGKPTADVKGKVTLDGNPLASGKIVFDEGAGIPAVELDIKNGVYEGKVSAGTKAVRISSYKTVPAPKGMTGPAYDKGVEENFLPAKYNSASRESREVKVGATNEFDFAVTSR